MKKLLIVVLVCALASFLFVGCFLVPDDPIPDPVSDPDIICEGGQYHVYYNEWSHTGCEGDWHAAGTYWYNDDGRVFLLGDAVLVEDILDIYGECPAEYLEEIFL